MFAVAHRTLKKVYANVLIVPGQQVFFLASDGALTDDIAARAQGRGRGHAMGGSLVYRVDL